MKGSTCKVEPAIDNLKIALRSQTPKVFRMLLAKGKITEEMIRMLSS
jgi:hypothetical protein